MIGLGVNTSNLCYVTLIFENAETILDIVIPSELIGSILHVLSADEDKGFWFQTNLV